MEILSTYDGDDYIYLDCVADDSEQAPRIKHALGSKEERFAILQDEPDFIKTFTQKELEIISYFYMNEATYLDAEYAIWGENTEFSNRLAVHMSKIKRALPVKNIPYHFVHVGPTTARFWRFEHI